MNKDLNIPKICHLFWDQHPMAYCQVLTVISFHQQNPDWEIIVWVSKQSYKELGENIFVGEYTGDDYFGMLGMLSYVALREVDLTAWGVNTDVPACSGSDMFRTRVLYRYGGVYSDFDVLWIKPISDLRTVPYIGKINSFESIVCFYGTTSGFQNVSVMIAQKESEYLASLIKLQNEVKPPYQHQSYGSTLVTEAYPTLHSIFQKEYNVLALPYKTFYPFSIFSLKELFFRQDLRPLNENVIGVHWFCGHELSLNFLNAKRNKDTAFTKIVQNIKRDL